MPPKKRHQKRQAAANRRKTPKTKSTTSTVSKRNPPKAEVAHPRGKATGAKRALEEDHANRLPSKRARTTLVRKRGRPASRPAIPPTINHPPTEVLAIIAFGNGESGELGLGPNVTESTQPRINPYLDPRDPSAFHVDQFSCGGMHTVALTVTNQIITWGVNDKSALGRETDWNGGLRDIEEDSSDSDGDLNPYESTPAPVPEKYFPSGTRFVQVAAGDSCSFALTDTGLVYGWGTFRDSKGEDRFSLDANGVVVEIQRKPACISGLEKITQIACGANHALALDATGNIWAWGASEQNQLGRRVLPRRYLESFKPSRVGVCRNNAKFIASGEYHSFAIDRKDNVWAWGLNSFGEAGDAKGAGGNSILVPYPTKVRDLCGENIIHLDGGAHHSVALTADGRCLAWGRMDCGQLGIDFTSEQLEDISLIRYDGRNEARICLRPTEVPNVGHVVYACCGTDHTIFIDKGGKAYVTGFGSQGQLGFGSYDDVQIAQPLQSGETEGRTLTGAGAGGQFSLVAALVK
ncbi:regulator of chromosome condensation 1/beta-lactamase-inhibitor protein II [Durotheca rogersii]|uniref:regulator of chromosome condensation 1/beta-lactamase-inhibitor protein II n=1 Tax=Durotheca rogersii TaxID=419775 RepID=UPI002220519D|nr:regulator of chromosome condensation 1/beta-lactamase-inhibitor protein II [Durotheca rogersii]KAI5860381.1 regulator of chromosome condensation 1/beta-lactamase-inhibitor protein II [Durotheca rogersii]